MTKEEYEESIKWIDRTTDILTRVARLTAAVMVLVRLIGEGYEVEEMEIKRLAEDINDEVAACLKIMADITNKLARGD